jgi:hypothetical protein
MYFYIQTINYFIMDNQINGFVDTIKELESSLKKVEVERDLLITKLKENGLIMPNPFQNQKKISKSYLNNDGSIVVNRKRISSNHEEITLEIKLSGYGETQKIKNHRIPYIIYDNLKQIEIEQRYLMGNLNSF